MLTCKCGSRNIIEELGACFRCVEMSGKLTALRSQETRIENGYRKRTVADLLLPYQRDTLQSLYAAVAQQEKRVYDVMVAHWHDFREALNTPIELPHDLSFVTQPVDSKWKDGYRELAPLVKFEFQVADAPVGAQRVVVDLEGDPLIQGLVVERKEFRDRIDSALKEYLLSNQKVVFVTSSQETTNDVWRRFMCTCEQYAGVASRLYNGSNVNALRVGNFREAQTAFLVTTAEAIEDRQQCFGRVDMLVLVDYFDADAFWLIDTRLDAYDTVEL